MVTSQASRARGVHDEGRARAGREQERERERARHRNKEAADLGKARPLGGGRLRRRRLLVVGRPRRGGPLAVLLRQTVRRAAGIVDGHGARRVGEERGRRLAVGVFVRPSQCRTALVSYRCSSVTDGRHVVDAV